MSITVVKEKAVTVVTVATDANSMLPPLCQILKSLFYSPVCCSVNRGLMRSPLIGAFGAVQIMVGLFNIGLGPGRISMHPEDFTHLKVAYWLGAVCILVGSVSVCADRFPSRCLVGFAVLMNIVGSIFAVVGIVMYAIDMGDTTLSRWCDRNHDNRNTCRFMASYVQRLLTGMDVTMIILSVLQLNVCITFVVLGIKALLNRGKGATDGKNYQPVLQEVVMTSPGA